MKILISASNMVHIKNFHLPYIEKFKEAGHDVYVMASGEGADYDIPFKKKAFCFKNFCLSFKIRKILKKERFDAVYLHTTLSAFWTRFAMWGLKKKPLVINTVHGYLFSEHTSKLKTKIYLLAERLMRKKTDYIVVMNEADLEIARENELCKREAFFIDGMGVRLDRIDGFKKASRDDGLLKLVYVGEISKRKNQIFLVKALSRLKNAYLTLVGDGEERESIVKYAKENGVIDRLEITGFTKNVREYLEKSDIYTSASVIEGLPFNIIEAMAAKMPIVASNIKGQRDLLPDDCLYPLNDIDAFISQIENTILDFREYGAEKYKLENTLPKNMKLYLDFLEN